MWKKNIERERFLLTFLMFKIYNKFSYECYFIIFISLYLCFIYLFYRNVCIWKMFSTKLIYWIMYENLLIFKLNLHMLQWLNVFLERHLNNLFWFTCFIIPITSFSNHKYFEQKIKNEFGKQKSIDNMHNEKKCNNNKSEIVRQK